MRRPNRPPLENSDFINEINEKAESQRDNGIKNIYFVQKQANKFNTYYNVPGVIKIAGYHASPDQEPDDNKTLYCKSRYDEEITLFYDDNREIYYIGGLREGKPKTPFDCVTRLFYHGDDYRAALDLHKKTAKLYPIYTISFANPTLFSTPSPEQIFNIPPSMQPSAYGINDWMRMDECLDNELFSGFGIPLGFLESPYDKDFYQLYYQDERHLITIAPNGTGKGTCAQIPVLLQYDAPMLVIDPKGENAAVTAKYRKEGMKHNVLILNPFNTLHEHFESEGFISEKTNQFKSACFNPLATLNPLDDNFVSDVASLAEALIDGADNDPFWTDSARELVTCLILYICMAKDYQHKKHLISMRKLLTGDKAQFTETMTLISESTKETHKYIDNSPLAAMAQKAKRFINDNKTNQSIISTAISQTSFLDDPVLTNNLISNDIDFINLKKGKMTVYVILPAKLLLVYSKWFKLVVTSALNALMSSPKHDNTKVLVMLDECPILGRLSCIETAVGLARGYGIQLWTFWQDIHQLYDIYQTRAESFMSNSGVQQYFTPNDMVMAEKLSKRLGDKTVFTRSISYNLSHNIQSKFHDISSMSLTESPVPFLNPVNLFGLPKDMQLLFFAGKEKAVLSKKIPYYENDDCKDRASKNPYI